MTWTLLIVFSYLKSTCGTQVSTWYNQVVVINKANGLASKTSLCFVESQGFELTLWRLSLTITENNFISGGTSKHPCAKSSYCLVCRRSSQLGQCREARSMKSRPTFARLVDERRGGKDVVSIITPSMSQL